MTRYRTLRLGCRASLLAITCATVSWSAPALRKQVDVHGEFAMFGNTLGWDCGPGVPAPLPARAARKQQEALPRLSYQKLAVLSQPVAQRRAASVQLMPPRSVAQATSTVEQLTQEKPAVRLALEAAQVKTLATRHQLVEQQS